MCPAQPSRLRLRVAQADASIARFDASNNGFFALVNAFRDASKLRDLSSIYTLLDVDGTYYIADKSGAITAYGDAVTGDPASAIERKREFRLPEPVTGFTCRSISKYRPACPILAVSASQLCVSTVLRVRSWLSCGVLDRDQKSGVNFGTVIDCLSGACQHRNRWHSCGAELNLRRENPSWYAPMLTAMP